MFFVFKTWTKFKQKTKSILYQFEPWAGHLKTIEGIQYCKYSSEI